MHTGQLVTRDDILGHTHEFAPTVDKLTVIGDGPLKLGPTGHYTDPQPGKAPDVGPINDLGSPTLSVI